MSGAEPGKPPGSGPQRSSTPPYRLRDFAWTDWPGVRALWQSAGDGVHLGRSDSDEEILKKWKHDPDLFLVAETHGEIIGAVMAGYDGRRGIVYHLAVLPRLRRRGVGRSLMAELERRLSARGCLKSYLLATPENRDAVEFYQRLGWEVMDMVLMGKELG